MRDDELFVPVEEKLRLQARAYKQLLTDSESLLEGHGAIFWTERFLLELIRSLYSRRLTQIAEFLPVEQIDKGELAGDNETLLAALGGHDLGQWEKVENGYQASCKFCQSSTWIGEGGMRYCLLEDTRPNREYTQ